uniref:INSulin related n=1 Tax=Caenorhabditis japonica TaxID=281687 RepID=A0A8R1EBS8_CAEJA
MNSSTTTVILVILLISCLSEAKPHHKHAKCTEKVYGMLKAYCDFRGHSEILHNTSIQCCQSNCDFTEMMAMCVMASVEDLRQ